MAKKSDVFADLDCRSRKITPRGLQGEHKENWKQFVERYKKGQYEGLSMAVLYDWGKKQLGLTCSVSCFRQELLNAIEEPVKR